MNEEHDDERLAIRDAWAELPHRGRRMKAVLVGPDWEEA